jgi:hypothetical protein
LSAQRPRAEARRRRVLAELDWVPSSKLLGGGGGGGAAAAAGGAGAWRGGDGAAAAAADSAAQLARLTATMQEILAAQAEFARVQQMLVQAVRRRAVSIHLGMGPY